MTVDINGASQTFIFQRDFTPTGRQNGIKMEGFEGTNLTADGVIILWPLVCAINIYFIMISKKNVVIAVKCCSRTITGPLKSWLLQGDESNRTFRLSWPEKKSYVFTCVHLSLGLSEGLHKKRWLNVFPWNLDGGWVSAQNRPIN